MKIKPVQIKNYAFGTVRIIDPETQGESRNAPNPTAATSIAWNIYSLSSGAEDATSYHIYLPPFCLLFNGTYCPVEPIAGARGNNDFFDITAFRGDLMCSVYKDPNNMTKAKLTIGPVQDAIYTFVVCSVNGTEKGLSVDQYVSGTFSITYGAKPFDPIIAVNGLPFGGGDNNDDEPPSSVVGFSNCYWMKGGVLQHMEDPGAPGTDGFIALKVDATYAPSHAPAVITYSDFNELVEAQKDPEFYVLPLYRIENGVITVDFRSTPQSQVAEVLV